MFLTLILIQSLFLIAGDYSIQKRLRFVTGVQRQESVEKFSFFFLFPSSTRVTRFEVNELEMSTVIALNNIECLFFIILSKAFGHRTQIALSNYSLAGTSNLSPLIKTKVSNLTTKSVFRLETVLRMSFLSFFFFKTC